MRGLLTTLRSIKTQIYVAYAVLAFIILAIVTGAVMGTRSLVRANTLEIGEMHSESRSVDGAGASVVDAAFVSGVGEMEIRGGASALLELDFTSNVPNMHPFIWYTEEDGAGDLFVSPSVPSGIPDLTRLADYRNEWTIHLNDSIPLSLEVVLGTGLGDFDFRGLTLTDLGVEIGTGEAIIDLRGDWDQSFHTMIDGGVGKTTVLLPDEVGVLVTADDLLSGLNVRGLTRKDEVFVNAVYGESSVNLDIDVDVGAGELNLVVLDENVEYTEVWDGEETE